MTSSTSVTGRHAELLLRIRSLIEGSEDFAKAILDRSAIFRVRVRQHLAAMTKRDADPFQILIGQEVQDGDVNVILGKAVRVLGKPEGGQLLRHCRHWGPHRAPLVFDNNLISLSKLARNVSFEPNRRSRPLQAASGLHSTADAWTSIELGSIGPYADLLTLDGRKVKLSPHQPDVLQGAPIAILYFEEAEVGKLRTAGPYRVTKNEIIEFAQKFDPLPIHTNEEIAARSVFSGLIASSAHTFAILISLLSKTQPYSLRIVAGLG